MAEMENLIADLVAANRILAHEGVVDAFGHVSVRHPKDPGRFLMSRARPPELVEPRDLMEFALDGSPLGSLELAASRLELVVQVLKMEFHLQALSEWLHSTGYDSDWMREAEGITKLIA